MDRFVLVGAVIAYVENRLTAGVDLDELSRAVGFSLAHLRQIFAEATGVPMRRYILQRRIAHAAFDLLYTDRTALDIATAYGFQNADTFTRAFRRCTGLSPQAFRVQRPRVARIKLAAGVYGVGLPKHSAHGDSPPNGSVPNDSESNDT